MPSVTKLNPRQAKEFTLTSMDVPPPVNNLFANIPGKGRIKSQRYRTWRNAAGWELKAQRPQRIDGPVEVSVTIENGASRADIDGLLKAPIDLLVEFGLIEGDHPSVLRRASIKWGECDGMTIEVKSV